MMQHCKHSRLVRPIAVGVLIVLLGGVFPARTAVAVDPPSSVVASEEIEVFVREGCPHCDHAKEFLSRLGQERPDVRIVLRDIRREPAALARLQQLAETHRQTARVPAFFVHGDLIVGFSDEATTGRMIRDSLSALSPGTAATADAGSCEAEESLSCEAPSQESPGAAAQPHRPAPYEIEFFGRSLSVEKIGLPLFTLAMGLLDGFNPCSMWVLLLMISLLAPLGDRRRMLAIAGTFIAVEGLAYFVFMAAWLNMFLFIGLSRISELIIAAIALLAGLLNLKDYFALGWGPSLSIPQSAKPDIYARMRAILHADNLAGAIVATVVLALLVQVVEFMCTSGFPALYTRILTLHDTHGIGYYGYLLLYNLAYMFDDLIILGIGVTTLSQHRLQEREGRWLKLISGLVMVALAVYLVVAGQA
jgi:glutaredoxin